MLIICGADQIISGRGKDLLRGNEGNDTIKGRRGSDILLGGNGDDVLNGGIGRDRLNGGAGNDTLTGGASIDRLIFNTNQQFETSAIGIDIITDFDVQRDLILLDKKTFTALESDAGKSFSVETDFAIVESDDAVATNGAFIVYNSASGALYYNANGSESGLGDGAQFAVLNNDVSLEANNFQIR
ncbi:MAG: calcium-binding protein [Okeania sp. SIO3C4]|nr:calcium-binding protein [Okeania sp. SIO3C4]